MILRLRIIDGVEDLREADPRILFLELLDLLPCRVVGRHFGRTLRALDHERHHLTAVHLGDRALFRIAVLHLAEVGELDPAAARQRNLHLRKRVGVLRVAEHAHGLLGAGDLRTAAGAVHVALPQLLVDLSGGDTLGLQGCRIEDHADHAIDPADAGHGGNAFLAQQALGDGVVDIPAELLERHVGRLRADVSERLVLGVDARDLRLEDSFRQVAADLRDRVADVVDRPVGRSAELEGDEGGAVALPHRAVDFVDAVDPAHRGFDALRDLRFHLVRCGARLRHRDDRRREVDVRRVVDLHPGEGDQPRQHQPDEENDGEDGVADAPGRNVAEVHGLILFPWLARTLSAPPRASASPSVPG